MTSISTGVRQVFPGVLDIARHPDRVQWERHFEGVEIFWITRFENGGPGCALIRFQPGARVAPHWHDGFEHIFVLSGSQSDDAGSIGEGSLMVHGPGTQHRITSESGCVVLAMYEKPVRFENA